MRSNRTAGTFALLQIDDSENDRLMVEEAISLTNTPLRYFGVDCIEGAIPFFGSHKPGDETFPRPAAILLDYDLGRQTGLDFLFWLRMMKQIKSVPVVMFSGSPGRDHVANCYATGANYYVSKPYSMMRLKNFVRTLHLSLLPHQGQNPVVLLHEYQPNPGSGLKFEVARPAN